MNTDNILEAFELLLNEIQETINILKNKISTAATSNSEKYIEEVKKYTKEVENIEKFKNKVIELKKEWENFYSPQSSHKNQNKRKILGRFKKDSKTIYRLKKGLRTNEKEFIIPILESLVELGGKAESKEVLKKVEEKMKHKLNEYDYGKTSSNSIRWKTTVRYCRENLVNDGLLSNNSPWGIWEITEEGRKYLEKVKEEEFNNEGV